MKFVYFMDVYPWMSEAGQFYPTVHHESTPVEQRKDATRYRITVEVPDPVKVADAGVEVEEVADV